MVSPIMNCISGRRFQDNAGQAQSIYMPHIAPHTILTNTSPAGKSSSQERIPSGTTIWRGIIWKMISPTRICKTSDNGLAFTSQYRILFPCSWYPVKSEGRHVVSEHDKRLESASQDANNYQGIDNSPSETLGFSLTWLSSKVIIIVFSGVLCVWEKSSKFPSKMIPTRNLLTHYILNRI